MRISSICFVNSLRILCIICFIFSYPIHAAVEKRSEAANDALKKALDVGEPEVSIVQIRLALGQFSELDKYYEKIFQDYKSNPYFELYFQKSYSLFNQENGISDKYLDRWVEETGSANAYIAKGFYLLNKGYKARGSAYANKTSNQQFDNMKKAHKQAFDSFNHAININPYLMPAYAGLITIAKGSKLPLSEKQILDLALSKDDRTFYVRDKYIAAVMPRWGGSFEEMSSAGLEAAKHVAKNPRLWGLQGAAYAETALVVGDDDCDKKIKYYSQALTYGDDTGWLHYRAQCYVKLKKHHEALDDYKKILFYIPNDKFAGPWVEWLEYKIKNNQI